MNPVKSPKMKADSPSTVFSVGFMQKIMFAIDYNRDYALVSF
jgi:hypothetical protein